VKDADADGDQVCRSGPWDALRLLGRPTSLPALPGPNAVCHVPVTILARVLCLAARPSRAEAVKQTGQRNI
jgi:hypothetical protein